jgi:hypothetical protein
MDDLIRDALEERAAEAILPPDAWERQKALLMEAGLVKAASEPVPPPAPVPAPALASASAPASGFPRPWARRLGKVAEVAAVMLLAAGLVALGAAYGSHRLGGRPDRTTRTVDPPVSEELNPRVAAPAPRVVIAPGLPSLTPPPGSLTQEQIVAAGVALLEKGTGVHGGQMTLTGISLVDGRWELEFRGDGRAIWFSSGPRPQDPRKGVYSHVVSVGRLTCQLSAATGELYATGITGSAPNLDKDLLEHYRGYIVSGGDQMTVRLVRADGSREGRDLTVWVTGQALQQSGLELWQLNYGVGRAVDIWGVTIAPGEVLADRLEMPDRPGEELLAHDVIHGIPRPDGAMPTKGIYRDGAGYTLAGATVESLTAWYSEQMPKYGWEWGKAPEPASPDAKVIRFVTFGWQDVSIAILPDPQGVQFTLSWSMTRLGNEDQAVDAVFRDLGDDPAFAQFPRSPGTAPGTLNIGGPAPGATIPATYETRVQRYPDGAWDVRLIRSWGNGAQTIWTFRVEETGVVHHLGQSGDQPPAIP